MEAKDRIKFRIGFSRMEKKYEWKDHLIFMGLLFGLAVWVNRGIEIKGLYMDDLYFWSCYGEQSFLQYVFPMGSTRFRFLYYLAAWLEMAGFPEQRPLDFLQASCFYPAVWPIIRSDRCWG